MVTGHYGSGKTNLAVNLALDSLGRFDRVTLVDLDIVNPYFRSSDYTQQLEQRGVHVVAPRFAGTTQDVPSLSAEVYAVFESEGAVIFDAGGDDAGATALGRFARNFEAIDYEMLYVINRYRNLTSSAQEAADLLREIEAASHLKATGIVNNSHLRDETSPATVLASLPFARETAELLGLPLVCTTVPKRLAEQFSAIPGDPAYVENAYPIEVYVRTPWEESPWVDEEVS
ncbi:MAG: ParA family protein [Coriobacteriia bacterium]